MDDILAWKRVYDIRNIIFPNRSKCINVYFEIPSGFISDRFGRKSAMLLGSAFTIIYFMGMLFANSAFSIFLFFVIYGFGIALLSGTEQSLIYDELLYKRRKKLYHQIIARYNFISISALAFSSF
ncbi:MFS transporter [Mannheimia haemolytica]|uniref:MFS transporter n=2 Tax=Mannheimia haemolytica TaxID=75985 RepID=UPI0038F7AE53